MEFIGARDRTSCKFHGTEEVGHDYVPLILIAYFHGMICNNRNRKTAIDWGSVDLGSISYKHLGDVLCFVRARLFHAHSRRTFKTKYIFLLVIVGIN